MFNRIISAFIWKFSFIAHDNCFVEYSFYYIFVFTVFLLFFLSFFKSFYSSLKSIYLKGKKGIVHSLRMRKLRTRKKKLFFMEYKRSPTSNFSSCCTFSTNRYFFWNKFWFFFVLKFTQWVSPQLMQLISFLNNCTKGRHSFFRIATQSFSWKALNEMYSLQN